jgi:hypothetical protein
MHPASRRSVHAAATRVSSILLLAALVPDLARGQLLGAGFIDGKLYDVNPNTGACTNPRTLGIAWALAFSPNGTLYGVTQPGGTPMPGELFTVIPSTGMSTPVAPTVPVIGVEGDIAFDPTSGLLYAIDGTGILFKINTSNGMGTTIGTVPGVGDCSGMAFDMSGNLYVVDTTFTTLLHIDKFNASVISSVNLTPPPNGGVAGMAFDPVSNKLFLASGLGTTDNLYKVNEFTGSMQLVGALAGAVDGLGALTFKPTPSAFSPFCFGDGSMGPCPCLNSGMIGRGCDNSVATGGAKLTVSGVASLSNDTMVLTTNGELASALSIVLQGSIAIAPTNFGDGLRCAGGILKRLYIKNAVAGSITAPQGLELPISMQSAAQGSPIPQNATRVYQVYYRDPSTTFCASPQGNTFNVSNAIAATWGM